MFFSVVLIALIIYIRNKFRIPSKSEFKVDQEKLQLEIQALAAMKITERDESGQSREAGKKTGAGSPEMDSGFIEGEPL